MMLYVIKDMKGDFQSTVFSFGNDAAAKRAIPFIVEREALYQRYPEDFVLYRVGEFDFKSGSILPEVTPVYICDLTVGGVKNED